IFDTQVRTLGRSEPTTIIDSEPAEGWWSEQYLTRFERSRVIAIEPDAGNLARTSSRLSAFGDRVELIHGALGRSAVAKDSSNGTSQSQRTVLTIDDICAERGLDVLGAFRMYVRDADFEALKGAEGMLGRGAIRFIVVRVRFVRLEDDVPEFGAVAE